MPILPLIRTRHLRRARSERGGGARAPAASCEERVAALAKARHA